MPAVVFTEDWERPDQDGWGSKWVGGESLPDSEWTTEGGRGYQRVSFFGNADDYVSLVAQMPTVRLVDFYVDVQTVTSENSNAWNYISWMSSGDIQPGAAGRMSTAWYLRRDIRTGANQMTLYRRFNNSEVSRVAGSNYGTTPLTNLTYRVRMDALDHVQIKIYPAGDPEPGSWDIDYTDPDGPIITEPGVIQSVIRKYHGADDTDGPGAYWDNLTVTDLEATEGPTARTKVWDGAQWVTGTPKAYDGALWVPGALKAYDGGQWV